MPRAIGHYLRNPHSPLRPLVSRAHAQDDLTHRVQACLPAEARHRVTGATVRGAALIVTVESPAWSAAVRYRAPDLLRRLRADLGDGVRKVTVRVRPPATPRPAPRRRAQAPSVENARLLERTADHIRDPNLQRALRRLARRHAP